MLDECKCFHRFGFVTKIFKKVINSFKCKNATDASIFNTLADICVKIRLISNK